MSELYEPDAVPFNRPETVGDEVIHVDAAIAAGRLAGNAVVAHPGFGRCPARVHPIVYLTYAAGRYHTLRRRAAAILERSRDARTATRGEHG